MVLTDDIQTFVHGIPIEREFVGIYFNSIHPWMPFLSEKLFMERVLSPLGPARPESTMLVATVKLIALPPPNLVARSAIYKSIKANLLSAEALGLLELKIFQSLVLLSLYELGHAIYPEAYMTIGHCIRYGHSLGLEKTVEQDSPAGLDNLEAEERRRSWWAIVVLEHLMTLGCVDRASPVGHPKNTSLLPADDMVWEVDGQQDVIQHRLCDPPTATMGRFCLTAQAAILLGKVFMQIHDPANDEGMRDHEARVLENTIAALTEVSLQEGRLRGVGVCSPTTICYR
ncbi:hypothetical protein H2200_006520 [Cladophialophora chaetospira]|uniref:Xylanolytic transcriptional activator regulatory domain-containing protein n=1 Tax=Cladophialophora chaetospira TaxID=386627 RepID=A0AA38X8J0_9EURO|nr:hypothetical protein H2200_006520 [Cladophialophora chaetospira]